MRPQPTSQPLRWLVPTALFLVLVLAWPALVNAGTHPAPPAPSIGPREHHPGTPLPSLADGAWLNLTVGGSALTIHDVIHTGKLSAWTRSYNVSVATSTPDSLVSFLLTTNPIWQWGGPNQFPAGDDALPQISDWSWTVTGPGGVNDTANWKVAGGSGLLERTCAWVAARYTVTGVAHPVESMNFSVPSAGSDRNPGIGVVLNPGDRAQGPLFPAQDADYGQLLQGLHASVVRFGEVDAQTAAHWSMSLKAPILNYTSLDAAFNLSAAEGAQVLYTFSAGTWGDGNLLPKGMPLNTSLVINNTRSSGYLPMPLAYRSYVGTIVAHFFSMHENATYWSIGNELPLTNTTVVSNFITIFNVAEHVIHSYYPYARVGTDVMMNRTYLPFFARWAHNVGFLSFHYYPAIGMCIQNGAYCPPAGQGHGTPDYQLWKSYSQMNHEGRYYAPSIAQMMWHNLTGNWVPVLDAESNLNGVGGSATNTSMGTDPRQQMLVSAAWLVATLMDGAALNLSALTYYTLTGYSTPPPTLTGPYGGWGFGMTAEGVNDRTIHYAPYWAAHIWGANAPTGSWGYEIPTPDPSVARAYVSQCWDGVNVIVVSLTAMHTKVDLTASTPGLSPATVTTVDQRSYVERFNAAQHREALWKSGMLHTTLSKQLTGPVSVVLYGYGVAVVHYVRTSHGAPSPRPGSGGGAEVPSTAQLIVALPQGPATALPALTSNVLGSAIGMPIASSPPSSPPALPRRV